MYNIYLEIENEIIESINIILDQYLDGRTSGTKHAKNILSREDYDSYFDGKKRTIYDAKKEFNKNISQLIKDINFAGYKNYLTLEDGETKENEKKYKELVKKLLNDTIKDRIALQKDNKVMEIKKFENFNYKDKLYEVKLPTMKLIDILDDVTHVNNDTLKRVLVSYYKVYADYIDLTNKIEHKFKIHDMVGDIMNNNRVSFDVCIFDKQDLDRIKINLVDFAIGEFHNQLPNNLNIFNIDMKPSSFINKDELKIVFDNVFTDDEVLNIITDILNWKFDGQFNDFYIWSNKQ